jgi:hypothetical protein
MGSELLSILWLLCEIMNCHPISAAGSARYGWFLYAGKGVPVDFTVAAEFFKKTSDSDDTDGETASVVVLSEEMALMRTSEAQFSIIKRPYLSLIRMCYITLHVVSNMGRGLTKISSAL